MRMSDWSSDVCSSDLSLGMLLAHGACWAALKADHSIAARAVTIARWMTLIFAALYVAAGVWLAYGIPGYAIVGPALPDGVSNPLYKQVAFGRSWFAVYFNRPGFWIALLHFGRRSCWERGDN